MITAGLLQFDAEGRVLVTNTPPVDAFANATPLRGNRLCYSENPVPPVYLNEIGYETDGRVCVGILPPARGDKGLRIAINGVPVVWWNGLPITSDGRLAVNPGVVPPVNTHAFSLGFAQGAFS